MKLGQKIAFVCALLALVLVAIVFIRNSPKKPGKQGIGGPPSGVSQVEAKIQAMSRWGDIGWSVADGAALKTGVLASQFAVPVCTTPANVIATTTTPSMRSCASGTTAGTFQTMGFDDQFDVIIGTTSNHKNLWLYTSGEMSSLSATRFWAAYITDQSATTMSTNDATSTFGSANLVGIRYSSVAGDTYFTLVLCNAGTCASTPSRVAADTNFHYFLIEMNDHTVMACIDPILFMVGTCVTNETDLPGSFAPSSTGI